MKLYKSQDLTNEASPNGAVLVLDNTQDPREVALDGIARIELHFPKFADGRAFSQAYLLRRRLNFQGEIRATGDVVVDLLQQMQRCGFDSAILRDDQSLETANRQLARFAKFYQGDALQHPPIFAKGGA